MSSKSRHDLHKDRSSKREGIGTVAMSPQEALLAWFYEKFPADKPNSDPQTSVNHSPPPEQTSTDSDKPVKDVCISCDTSNPAPKRSIFFIRASLECCESGGNDPREIGFGELVKSCTACKKGFDFKPEDSVYMYRDWLFCSPECRNGRICADGFTLAEFGIEEGKISLARPLMRCCGFGTVSYEDII